MNEKQRRIILRSNYFERHYEEELHQFLRHPMVDILDVDDDAARIYAEIMVSLHKAGTPLPTNDIWIAAVAAREGATVLTYDEHFRWIQRAGSTILTF